MKQNEFKSKGLKNKSGDKPPSKEKHVIELFASVASNCTISNGYELPNDYNIDRIVIMPVNNDTTFVYWELTNRLLNSKLHEINVGSVKPVIKIFEIEQGRQKEIYSFEVKEKIGNRYIKYNTSFKPLVAGVGILKEGKFIELLKSKTISKPSFETKETEDEIWMEKTKDMYRFIKLPGSKITNIITHHSEESELLKYYRELTKLHKDHLSSEKLFK
jgi:hypothetical protein